MKILTLETAYQTLDSCVNFWMWSIAPLAQAVTPWPSNDSIWSIFSAGPVSPGAGVNYEDCYDQVVTICSRASRDNYHKPHGPSTD